MRVFRSLDEIRGQIPNPAVTVGSFDGVHAGHRAILRTLAATAKKNGGESVVVTFHPHPRQVVGQGVELLNSLEEKLWLLERLGVDNVFVIEFTPEFSRLGSDEFARKYLREGIGATSVVTGHNHRFGRGRTGDRDILHSLFEVVPVPEYEEDGAAVSSTIIRAAIRNGRLAEANRALVDPYFFITAADGGYGEPAKLFPPDGVYPVTADGHPMSLTVKDGRPALPKMGKKAVVRF